MSTTPKEIAEWMMQELRDEERLHQYKAARYIKENYGEEFTYQNNNGNLAINKNILAAFRKLDDDKVVWDSYNEMWRFRNERDAPGRKQ